MTNEEKAARIRPRIGRDEGVTVQFLGEPPVKGEVTGCSDVLVDLSIEAHIAFMRQTLSVPLRLIELLEDQSSHTRGPEQPLEGCRLKLFVEDKRLPVIS